MPRHTVFPFCSYRQNPIASFSKSLECSLSEQIRLAHRSNPRPGASRGAGPFLRMGGQKEAKCVLQLLFACCFFRLSCWLFPTARSLKSVLVFPLASALLHFPSTTSPSVP